MAKKPLLVDGNNLFAIGFHGMKGYSHNGNNVGGLFHFMTTLRSFLIQNNHDKVIVFWDGENSSLSRKKLYPKYKENRSDKKKYYDVESFDYQRLRVKQYLEEAFIRQCEASENEADDLISYYCSISNEDKITIFSGDRDLSQLISDKVSLYLPDAKRYVKNNDLLSFNGIDIISENIILYKMIVGDKSDNISGIKGFGNKKLFNLCPDFGKRVYTLEEVKDRANQLLEVKKEKSLFNLIQGENDSGIEKSEFFSVVRKIVDLSNPIITEEGKLLVKEVYEEKIDPEDRGHKNLIKLMIEDGFFKFLPKKDDAWVDFIRPFTKLIRKEKKS